MTKPVGAAFVGLAFMALADLSTGQVLGLILAVDLAQFALVVEHRGRLARVEEETGVEP